MTRPPAILSPWFLPVVAAVLTLVLAGLCIRQWQREAVLRARVLAAEARATMAESTARENLRRADEMTTRHLDASARAEALTGQLADVRAEAEIMRQAAAERDAMAAAMEEARHRLRAAKDAINALNHAAGTRKETNDRLTAERDSLLRMLNDRTKAYNDLVKRMEAEKR